MDKAEQRLHVIRAVKTGKASVLSLPWTEGGESGYLKLRETIDELVDEGIIALVHQSPKPPPWAVPLLAKGPRYGDMIAREGKEEITAVNAVIFGALTGSAEASKAVNAYMRAKMGSPYAIKEVCVLETEEELATALLNGFTVYDETGEVPMERLAEILKKGKSAGLAGGGLNE